MKLKIAALSAWKPTPLGRLFVLVGHADAVGKVDRAKTARSGRRGKVSTHALEQRQRQRNANAFHAHAAKKGPSMQIPWSLH